MKTHGVSWIALASSAAALAVSGCWATALAQTSPPQGAADVGAADIVVTANRREQSLQDVGIAVVALSGEALKSKGLSSSTDIAQITPGVYASGSLGGQSQQFTIRGVTQSDFNDAIEAPVAAYVDDIYIPTQQGQTLALFDVQRVEVLKGPQGTLFGRNATGGLVNTVIVQPDSSRLSGFGDISYGRFNEAKAEAALNVPLGEWAAIRASGYYSRISNFWHNVYPEGLAAGAPADFGSPGSHPSPCCQDEGGNETYAGRLQLKLTPTDALTIRLMGQGARQDLSTAPYTAVAAIGTYDDQGRLIQSDRASPTETRLAIGSDGGNYTNFAAIPLAAFAFPGDGTRAPGATWFGYDPVSADDLKLSSDFARNRLNRASGYQLSSHVDYDFGGVTLTSITAYQHYKKQFLMDGDGTPNNLFLFGTKANTDAWSEELRLSGRSTGLNWTTGLYFLDIDAHTTQGLLGPKGSLLAAGFGLPDDGVDAIDVVRLKTRSISVFGQFDYEFAPRWTIVLGGRLIRERQIYDFVSFAARNDDDFTVDDQVALFLLQPDYADRRSKTLWAAKAQLEYRPAERILIYAGVNRGVKGGSYNAPIPDGSPPLSSALMSYGPETLINYEGGVKFGDRLFSVNASAFYYDYQDYQAFLFRNNSGFVQNTDARVYGFDIDMGFQLADGLHATVGGSYTHAVIPDFEIAPGVFRDVRPTYAPRTQLSGDLTYTVPSDVFDGRLTLNAQASYASGFYHNIRNFNADWFNGRTLINLSGNWTANSGIRIGVYAKNLLDKRYGLIGFDSVANFGGNIESYGMPRTYGVSLGYKF
ncbi:TonB-dependent receptor [Sphingobium sp.]|uniref:TonB-dependent receptor n=1 Tax=Sphingobium sp. TaxID=1912891 RepID=UPI0028BE2614|nr:TonB-dependent receptor [Sphingobium sp.]